MRNKSARDGMLSEETLIKVKLITEKPRRKKERRKKMRIYYNN